MTLQGRTALVTGGSRGIGAAIVARLAAAGARVAFTYANATDAAAEVERKAREAGGQSGGEAHGIRADMAEPAAIAAAISETVSRFGGLDILVNNAGAFELKPLGEATLEDYDSMMALNVRGVFVATTEAAKHLPEGGRIVNIGSINGDAMPFGGGALYAASKGAVQMLSKGWARDLGPRGITVNVVQPGPIDTALNPADGPYADFQRSLTALGRYGEPSEVADLVTFLAGPEAANITGAAINIDGGVTA